MVNPLFVTAFPPSSVTHSRKGCFTGPHDINLVVAKCSSLEIYRLGTHGLELMHAERLYGRLTLLELYRSSKRSTDCLFICTERFQYAILSWDATHARFVTEQAGSLAERAGRPIEDAPLCFVDPKARFLGLLLYQGMLKIVPLDDSGNPRRAGSGVSAAPTLSTRSQGKRTATAANSVAEELPEPFTIRMPEQHVLSLAALRDDTDAFAVLFQDAKGTRHVRTYTVSLRDKELAAGPIKQVTVPASAHLLVPLHDRYGGFLVFAHRAVLHFAKASPLAAPPAQITLPRDSLVKTYSPVDNDDSRILVGDVTGNYTLLSIKRPAAAGGPAQLGAYFLGNTTTCTTLTYLDGGYAYLGSHFGDSALVRLLQKPDADGRSIETVRAFPNIGPVSDFVIMDSPGQAGAGQLVTCSGAFHNGSLRVIRHGIEISPLVKIELPALARVLACRVGEGALVALSIGTTQTVFLALRGDDLDQVEHAGPLVEDAATLALAAVGDNGHVVQVTARGAAMYAAGEGDLAAAQSVSAWAAPENEPVLDARIVTDPASGATHTVVALKSTVVDLNLDPANPVEKSVPLSADIACIDVHAELGLAAVATWDRAVLVFAWPAWTPVVKLALDEYEARSLAFAKWDVQSAAGAAGPAAAAVAFLLCGRGDGSLVSFDVSVDRKAIDPASARVHAVGTKPLRLARFRRAGQTLVFGSCDHPIVLHASMSGKLMYSNVNLPPTTDVCSFESEAFGGDALLVAADDGLTLGTMDPIENLHITTHHLNGEMPRRIAHHAASRTLAVAIERLDETAMFTQSAAAAAAPGTPDEEAFIKLFDDASLDVVAQFALDRSESPQALSLLAVPLLDTENSVVAVGTAYVVPGEEEPRRGRVLMFRVAPDRSLRLVSATTVKGAVYSFAQLPDGRIAAGINNRVHVFEVDGGGASAGGEETGHQLHPRELKPVCSHPGFIIALFLESRGDYVVVGDLMKSVTILLFNAAKRSLELVAKDPAPSWVTAIATVDDDHVLAADAEHNVYVARRVGAGEPVEPGATPADDEARRRRLEIPSELHLGEFVNRFRRGSIRPPPTSAAANGGEAAAVTPLFVSASVHGHLGVVATVPRNADFTALLALQEVLAAYLADRAPPVGGLEYGVWRQFHNPRKVVAMHGAVDGDLVEKYLDLGPEDRAAVLAAVARNVGPRGENDPRIEAEYIEKLVEEVGRLH
ncbi:hypothetical protein H9P43_007599 [Blastocladiella emersonii ATCC 22665]|nr:hypothetical protein H9P43_007599 [Blastocladiella emersonii ATCC 22665]